MKKIFFTLSLIFAFAILTQSCQKDPVYTNDIQGKWMINSVDLGGIMSPGNGSYLIFMGGESNCKGSDFDATTQTHGSFSYEFNADGTILTIHDADDGGGNYNGSYQVNQSNDNQLSIIGQYCEGGVFTINLTR